MHKTSKMAANRKKQDDKNLEILRELITINGNKYCLDCNQRGPTYVNTTIGSFVCSKCSGMLRGLTPPHRVKSISMATFTPEEIEFIKARGNDYCRCLWLGLYEGEKVNFTDEQSVRDFMIDKYEKKRFYLESNVNNHNMSNGNGPLKNNVKNKAGINANSNALISITTPQVLKVQPTSAPKAAVNNLLPNMNEISQKIKPVKNVIEPFLNSAINSIPDTNFVPDFPVDFSTADIYNGNQYSNNVTNNNFLVQSSNTSMFNQPASSSNDRYAALADLDMALRQENMKMMEKGSAPSNNPFQNSTTNDVFGDKNPFFNGGWNSSSVPIQPVNPFMAGANNGSHINSNNPFL